MIRIQHDGFTTAALSESLDSLILAACVHCSWLVVGTAEAVAIGKRTHVRTQHADADRPNFFSLPLQ